MRQVREQIALFTPAGPQGIQLWANSATQELAALAQEFGFRLNRVAPLDGSENFTGVVTFEAGIKILDSTGADSALFSHDGTDFNTAFTSTTDWNLTGLAVFKLFDGCGLQIFNSTDTDSALFSHKGTDFNATFVNTTDWNIGGLSGGILVRDGAFLQIMDATDANAIRMSHDGADFNVIDQAGTTNMNITGMNVVVAENLVVDHNGNTGGVSSGTYTPSLTNSTNVAASTAFVCQWMRVGDSVTVSGRVNIDPTASDTATLLDMSLPVAAAFADVHELAGTAIADGAITTAEVIGIRANTVTEEAQFRWFPGVTDNTAFAFVFMYEI